MMGNLHGHFSRVSSLPIWLSYVVCNDREHQRKSNSIYNSLYSIARDQTISEHDIVRTLCNVSHYTSSPRMHRQLWRHHKNVNRPSGARCRCGEIVFLIVIHGFIMSCKKQNDACTVVTNYFCANSTDISQNIPLVSAWKVRHSNPYVHIDC